MRYFHPCIDKRSKLCRTHCLNNLVPPAVLAVNRELALEVAIVILVVVAVVIAFLIGISTASSLNPPALGRPDDPKADASCGEACFRWDNARQMQCSANADETAARSRADGIRGEMFAALAAATAFAAAAVAALVAAAAATATIFGIPAGIVLTGVAIGLFAASAAALAAASVFAGQLVSAESDTNNQAAPRRSWDAEVAAVRQAVNRAVAPSMRRMPACRGQPRAERPLSRGNGNLTLFRKS